VTTAKGPKTHLSRLACAGGLAVVLLAANGCRHKQKTPPPQAMPPAAAETARVEQTAPPRTASKPLGRIPITPVPQGGVSEEDLEFVSRHKPILSQEGFATWYTAPYKGRKAANGEVFDDSALTAANRTLPMGSLIVVTNLNTGQSSAMRISDRGPFVEGQILDMTIASAKATGVYRAGLVRVRMDVYQTPKPINSGGRWCVQIGAFRSERTAIRLKQQLLHHYPEANVIEFPGENSYWVRIRPEGDDRKMAEYISRHLRLPEGDAFLTRLD
jgi:rare lipoprotein A